MVYAWEEIKEVTYRSEVIDGVEIIYPISSKKGTSKTVDFETLLTKKFGFRNAKGNFYEITDINGNKIVCDATFSIHYDERLMVNMDFKGILPPSTRPSSINAQGWERNADSYFRRLLNDHEDWFDTQNKKRIINGESPIINDTFLKYFPEYEEFWGQKLILY